LHVPRAWDFKMDGICAVVYLCDFDNSDPVVLFLYGNVIIFARHLEKCMLWCLKILTYDIDLKDDGV
jgi:hypothetical protein